MAEMTETGFRMDLQLFGGRGGGSGMASAAFGDRSRETQFGSLINNETKIEMGYGNGDKDLSATLAAIRDALYGEQPDIQSDGLIYSDSGETAPNIEGWKMKIDRIKDQGDSTHYEVGVSYYKPKGRKPVGTRDFIVNPHNGQVTDPISRKTYGNKEYEKTTWSKSPTDAWIKAVNRKK